MSYSVRVHVGQAGCGKSYDAKRAVSKFRGPVVVWDHGREYAGPAADDPPRKRPTIVYDFEAFLRAQAASPKRIAPYLVFQVAPRYFDSWCRWVRMTGKMLAVIDEAHLVSTPGKWRKSRGGGPPEPSPFFELLTTARHRELHLLIVTQRPVCIPRDATAQVTELRAWRTTEPNDLAWLADVAGKTWAEGLRSLPNRRCLTWEP